MIIRYKTKDVYNEDKTSIFLRIIPTNSLELKINFYDEGGVKC